jgi:ribosomal protein S18 acetylase RimI-like enzyme
MAHHSIEEARKIGFHSIQFNFVVKSNIAAINLWKSVGFEIIGEIPDAFRHTKHGLTNAYIMYRKL